MKGKVARSTTSGTPTSAPRHTASCCGPANRPASTITESPATDATVATRTERLQGAENSARTSVMSGIVSRLRNERESHASAGRKVQKNQPLFFFKQKTAYEIHS